MAGATELANKGAVDEITSMAGATELATKGAVPATTPGPTVAADTSAETITASNQPCFPVVLSIRFPWP